jgi:hypothetical protein
MPQTANQQKRPTGGRQQPPPEPMSDSLPAETDDHVYGLVSVLYHALQGVQACEQYVADAERAGDDELVKFFEECCEAQKGRAARAKQLLVDRADADMDEDEDEDESADEDEDEEA